MARVIGPESGSRLCYVVESGGGLGSAVGASATVYSDAGGTVLADILTVGGSPIAGSVVVVGSNSELPLFQFPDGVDTVYVSVAGGPVTAVYSRADSTVVHNTGNESVGGVKTFTSAPVLPSASFAASAGQAQGVGSAGSAATVPHSDHAHPLDTFMHTDHGLLAWNMPPYACNAGAQAMTAGTVYVFKVPVPVAVTVSTLWIQVSTPGGTLTSGQNFIALYSGAGALLQTSADQTAAWSGAAGVKQAAITATALPAGFCYVAVFGNGTTPTVFRAAASGATTTQLVNANLASPNYLWASTADTGRTTTMPANLTTPYTAYNSTVWVGLS